MKKIQPSPNLIDILRTQRLIHGEIALAKAIAAAVHVMEAKAKERIIKQGDDSTDVYLILAGSVEILVNGRPVATRAAGQHVGEMAVVMHSARTASVVTSEKTTFAVLDGKSFLRIANKFPIVWRGISHELAHRLHQRRNLIREPNAIPYVFVASSKECLKVAQEVQRCLSARFADTVEIRMWTDRRTFKSGRTTIEELARAAQKADFAVVILGKDDVLRCRGKQHCVPRDNVIFEAGLFIGGPGRARTFLLRPSGVMLKLPSDLDGVTIPVFRRARQGIDASEACATIIEQILTDGPR